MGVMLRTSRHHLYSVLSSWDSRDSRLPVLPQLYTTEQTEAQNCGPKKIMAACQKMQTVPADARADERRFIHMGPTTPVLGTAQIPEQKIRGRS